MLLVPFNLIISENRAFQVVDKNLNPVAGCSIRHEWIQYSLDVRDEDLIFCDNNGFVFLPKRIVKTSVLEILKSANAKFKKYGLNASFSSHDIITIKSDGYENHVIFDGKGIENGKVVLELKIPR